MTARKNTTTAVVEPQFDIDTAREALAGLTFKGRRPAAALEFIQATTDQDRQDVVDGLGAGLIRRGLRQLATRMERVGNQQGADSLRALRDDIDESDGTVFPYDESVDDVEDAA